jgi:glycerol-3-phosphate dehydrogenase
LLINLMQTAAEQGATVLNYVQVTGFARGSDGFIDTVWARDNETGQRFQLGAKVVVNATGPFSDAVRRMADPGVKQMIAPSQGIHLVFDRSFLLGESAIMVPHTSDGRVMFAIPWHGHTLVGTTDTPIPEATLEPVAMEQEIQFILDTAAQYLAHAPQRSDVLSVFTGIRPLVRAGDSSNTSTLSRDHTIHIDQTGLLTIAGGKWTTYRNMAEDCVNQAATLARLPDQPCITRTLHVHGFHSHPAKFGHLGVYGSDAHAIQDLMRANPELTEQLHPALPYVAAEVIWAVRVEMARKLEDVLGRRLRALFLNAHAAAAMAPRVAELMGRELGWDAARQVHETAAFLDMAETYFCRKKLPTNMASIPEE